MEAKFLKESILRELMSQIHSNLDKYRKGNFDDIIRDPSLTFTSDLEIDEITLSKITCTNDNQNEVENCLAMHDALKNLSGYLARDARLWTFLTHSLLLDYTRKRWPIPEDDEAAIKHIRSHFFCVGQRGIERDNAASRLWWQASLCKRVKNLSLKESLEVFLYKSDVRANIVERPSTSQNVIVFTSVINKLHESLMNDKLLFERSTFRKFMKQLNLAGGVTLIPALDQNQVNGIIEECSKSG